ncbi:MAG: hypothetical protein H7833_02115 [Magnetococcus sp. DMHC-1]|nr:hypothetical protein [Magnetococcales bacterium]
MTRLWSEFRNNPGSGLTFGNTDRLRFLQALEETIQAVKRGKELSAGMPTGQSRSGTARLQKSRTMVPCPFIS